MTKQKGGQAHRIRIGRRVLKTLAGILAGAGIGFSGRYNALYGKDEFAAIPAQMCESGRTAEEAVRILGAGRMAVPSARWFRNMMRSVRPDRARRVCAGLMRRSVATARGQCLRRTGPVTVAIDKHEIPRYDKKNMANLVYSKRKSGTNKSGAYATMQAVGSEANVTIGCLPVTRDRSDRDFVRDLPGILRRSGIRCGPVLMDREFYSADVMRTVSAAGRRFLMPAVKNTRVKEEIARAHGSGRTGGCVVPGFSIRNSEGRTARFSLVIVPSKKHGGEGVPVAEQYHAFATSLEYGRTLQYLEELPPEYGSRWGIETGYRQTGGARARTTGTNPDVRTLLFHLSAFMYNMWAIERARDDLWCTKKEFTLLAMTCALVLAATDACNRGFPGPPPAGTRPYGCSCLRCHPCWPTSGWAWGGRWADRLTVRHWQAS